MMTDTLNISDFRDAFRGEGVAWPGTAREGEKPEGWPFMSMDAAARRSAELVRKRRAELHEPVTLMTNVALVAVVVALAAVLLWWLSPTVLSVAAIEWAMVAAILSAASAAAAAITLAIWSHP